MKSDSQFKAIIIFFLIIIAGVLIFLAFNLNNNPSNVTGQVITNQENSIQSNEQIVSNSIIVSSPFIADNLNIRESQISFSLTNAGGEDYTIYVIELSNCDFYRRTTPIEKGEKIFFNIPCDLTSGAKYNGDFHMYYWVEVGNEKPSPFKKATGSLFGVVK